MENVRTERVRPQEDNEETIDLLHLLSVLWKKAWLILLVGILAAAIGFSYASFVVDPTYSSTVTMYVNNTSSVGGVNFNLSDLNAAKSLVDTYLVILRNRTTLELVLEHAGSDYTYDEFSKMISASAINNTEVFGVTITSTDPYEAARLANAVAEVLPTRVADIMDGASMRLVDSAVPDLQKVAPSVTRYTAIGLFAGIVLMCAILIVQDLLDDVIRDENHILQTYEIPILSRVPDLLSDESGRGYYSSYGYGKSQHSDERN